MSTAIRVIAITAVSATILIVAIGYVRSNRRSEPIKSDDLPVNQGQYSESPILRDRVERGELPPVEERLPKNPLVVPPVEGIGRYSSDPE